VSVSLIIIIFKWSITIIKRTRFTEHQIITVLKQQDIGMKVADICWEHGTGFSKKTNDMQNLWTHGKNAGWPYVLLQ
jgi:hypothetical protein